MRKFKLLFLSFLIITPFLKLHSQAVPLNPVSYRIFSPFQFNPAIAGSKDFSSLNIISVFQDGNASNLLSAEGRLTKKGNGYFSSGGNREFSNFGIGGSVFKDLNGNSTQLGGSVSAAYHIPLSKNRLSFLSIGTSVKGVQNSLEYGTSVDSLGALSPKETFFPNIDLGIYFYSGNIFAGISATNLLGNPEEADSLGNYEIPVSQTYNFNIGFKIMLIPSINLVVEPSILFEMENLDEIEPTEVLHPLVKVYLEEFCFGMYFYDKDVTSFFFQYRYPGFYLGAFYGLKKNSAYYLNKPLLELTAGVNLSRKGMKVRRSSHW